MITQLTEDVILSGAMNLNTDYQILHFVQNDRMCRSFRCLHPVILSGALA
ncbi:MAG: hypothetical protein IJ464_06675 [Alistipes sp.]|nr:hypothetical protein [Alistipes sp.]